MMPKTVTNKSVAIGLSGGVDSAVAAFLLKKAGYDVTGVFLKTFEQEESTLNACSWEEDQKSAREVASFLNIPFASWNFSKEYEQEVLQGFFLGLSQGLTPNPDIYCNTAVKFGAFLSKATKSGFKKIATGHYVRTMQDRFGETLLLRGIDSNKDQSYFLSRVGSASLAQSLFPLGSLTKKMVRQIARDVRLPNAERPDSQGICFIGDLPFSALVKTRINEKSGPIKTKKGKMLGFHTGLSSYTIGQRKGLNIGGLKKPLFVAQKNVKKNEIIVSEDDKKWPLYTREFLAESLQWINMKPLFNKWYDIQIRYRQTPQKAFLTRQGKYCLLKCKNLQRAVTPGQIVALFRGSYCAGSAIIKKPICADS